MYNYYGYATFKGVFFWAVDIYSGGFTVFDG